MTNNIRFADISVLDEKSRLSVSHLVIESLPVYYRSDGMDDAEMVAAVAGLIGHAGSEIEKGFAAFCGTNVAGTATFLHSEHLQRARLVGAQALLRLLSGPSARQFRNNLKNYNTGFAEVPDGAIYLSRFAVDPYYRGKGLADQMMERFLSLRPDGGDRWSRAFLHVDRQNHRAVAFYTRHGFGVYEPGERYLTMEHLQI
ncbi:MAG: N-acetyltransferase [Desulfobacteraceae bacterium]|nr:MAG: N-acetyltransferase [Desulfobacteraceae bacterium]